MCLFDPGDPRPIHFLGIGGAGMCALALVAQRRGVAVTGCDIDPRGAADVVQAGATVSVGHDPAHVRGARAVVYTSAVPPGHDELQAAALLGIPCVKRAVALGELVRGADVVGVAGTHGKTTTTAMVTECLVAAGCRPTGITGGRVEDWGGNARLDGDNLFVVEADEYDRSFLALHPTIAVVTNVEADHLECYGTLSALEDAFVEFASRAKRVLVGADDPGAMRIAKRVTTNVWRVGTVDDADIGIRDVVQTPTASDCRLTLPDDRVVPLRLTVPGLHNVRNAAMAVAATYALEVDLAKGADALARFAGVGRRFDVMGTVAGVTVVDDYAHHPSEVEATLEAARQRFPGRRLVAVFQPHLFSRTQRHGQALGSVLAGADLVVVTDIYPARERPIAGVTAEIVVRAARDGGATVEATPDRAGLAPFLAQRVVPGDVVLTLGAGDITEVASELLDRLAEVAA